MKKHLETLAAKFNVQVLSITKSDKVVTVEIVGQWQDESKFSSAVPDNVIVMS